MTVISQIEDLQAIFRSSPDLYLILNTSLEIVEVSDAYLFATHARRDEIVGMNIFDAFPDNPNDPQATGVNNLNDSLQRVLKTGMADTMAVQKYSIRNPAILDNPFEVRYWSPHNSPVFDANGELKFIIHKVEDVTEYIHLKQVGLKQIKITDELRFHAGKLEVEVYKRAQQLQEANRLLREEKERADKASNIKSAFLAAMSHEIRTPLNGIIGMTEILMDSLVLDDQREALDIIRVSGETLMSIINDILDFSKLESGQIAINNSEFTLRQLVDETFEMVTPQVKMKAISIQKIIPEKMPDCFIGDPVRIRQVLTNLVGNASKFTEKGKISLKISYEEDGENNLFVTFEVQDTGIGFDSNVRDNLFHAFYQGDASMTKKYGGTGLGLAISKQLVEVMGGVIGADSTPGKGSTFWFRLPLTVCQVRTESEQSII